MQLYLLSKIPVELEQGLPWKVAGKITYRNLGEMH